jgi:hypothetical protein
MASTFAWKYDYVAPSPGWLAPGSERTVSFGPAPLTNGAIAVTAVPFRASGPVGQGAATLEVTRVLIKRSGEDRWVVATIKNLGPDWANAQVVVGGVREP